ncbi:virulence-associated E family protein [Enterococcus faecalis]|uniref:virulence-associated E family protein n=1 Tax=Enterococcus faecalis TaxID=1351 RepID=UPI000667CF6F|nr:virulence-associated E family protein [Enterococcus faecalis]
MAHKDKTIDALDFPEAEVRKNNIVELNAWTSRLRRDHKNLIKSNSVVNAELILSNDSNLKGTIGYNEFSGYIHLLKDSPWINRKAGTWEDNIEDALVAYIEENYQVVFDDNKIHKAVVNVARRNVFNPVKERIEQKTWDKQPRLETMFIDLLGVEDNIYTREVTKRWVVGSVARIYQPGIKFELVPVLDGKQGIGKSTVANLLYTDDFFTDSLDSLGEKKDDYIQLQGNAVIELGELSSMSKTKVEQIKNFISAKVDKIRPPYGRNTVNWQRQCVFIGTSNDSQYLKDLTGERRFYPLPCRNKPSLNVFKLSDDYFLQILAEAKALFEQGQRIYFDREKDREILGIAKKYQDEAKLDDPIRDSILKYLEMEVPKDWDNAKTWGKRLYYRDYPNSKEDRAIMKYFPYSERFFLLESVLTADILEVVFEKDTTDLVKTSSGSEAKKISLIIENLPDWERKQLFNRNNRRGFYNSSNAEKNKE